MKIILKIITVDNYHDDIGTIYSEIFAPRFIIALLALVVSGQI